MAKQDLIQRESEKYSQQGNISAQGIQKLLGAPNLDRLQTVIRESVQNSWDASKDARHSAFHVGLRDLGARQSNFLRKNFFNDITPEKEANTLARALDQKTITVLELSDYGTTGLGGPTDPSVVTTENEETDFVNFMRNIGSPRDTHHGGGTYGYGKSSLYGLSKCQTIIVDTMCVYEGKPTRRLMGSRIASNFSIPTGKDKGKYTGRHWWGSYSPNGKLLEPLTGNVAKQIAKELGVPKRTSRDTGTTIMIIDPVTDEDSEELVVAIQRSLLWNFWPKMISKKDKEPAMVFRTYLNGSERLMPSPSECPPLDIFACAMEELKEKTGQKISSKRPKKDLGLLVIQKDQRGDRLNNFGETSDGMFPANSCHVAVMRPAELVVKYLKGNPFPTQATEWAGVFVCSSENEVESAFAQSEPPAHDDWNPAFLPKGSGKTYVRTALKLIKQEMDLTMPSRPITADPGTAELGKLSDRMGKMLSGTIGDGISAGSRTAPRKKKKDGSRQLKQHRITNLQAWGPEEFDDGQVLAWFSFDIEVPENHTVILTGSPKVYIDGELKDAAPNGKSAEIVAWLDKSENLISSETVLSLALEKKTRIWVGTTIPDEVAISFTPRVINEG